MKFLKKITSKVLRHKFLIFLVAILIAFGGQVAMFGNEVGMRVVLTAIGIDKKGDQYSVSAQVFTPQSTESKVSQKSLVSVEAPTLAEAINKIGSRTGRIATVSHCKIIVLGDSVLKEEISRVLSYFMLSAEVSWGTIVTATDAEAEKTLEGINELEQNSSFSWQKFLANNRSHDTVTVLTLRDFYVKNQMKGETLLLNVMSVEKPQEGGESQGSGTSGESGGASSTASDSGGGQSSSSGGKSSQLVIGEKTKIVRGGVVVGELDEEGARGYSWLDPLSAVSVFHVKEVDHPYFQDAIVSVRLEKRTVQTRCSQQNGVPQFSVCVQTVFHNVEVLGSNSSLPDQDRADAKKALETAIVKEVNKQFDSCVRTGLETSADIFGLNERFFRSCPDVYRKWGETLFQRAAIDFKIDVNAVL